MRPEIWLPIVKATGEVICALLQDPENNDID